MPAILDAPEVLDYEEHDLSEAQPQLRPARAGFWRTLVQYLGRQSVHRGRYTPSSHRSMHTESMQMLGIMAKLQ